MGTEPTSPGADHRCARQETVEHRFEERPPPELPAFLRKDALLLKLLRNLLQCDLSTGVGLEDAPHDCGLSFVHDHAGKVGRRLPDVPEPMSCPCESRYSLPRVVRSMSFGGLLPVLGPPYPMKIRVLCALLHRLFRRRTVGTLLCMAGDC